MLKKKFDKLSLICVSLLLMSANSKMTGGNNESRNIDNNLIRTSKHDNASHHVFDSTGLCICLSQTNDDITDAPKINLNAKALKFVNDYLKKNGTGLMKIKERCAADLEMINNVFCEYDLPTELKYLAVVESELKSRTVSTAGAAGIWQLMPETARLHGLKITSKYDERRLIIKSTKAAAQYLNELYLEFNDWLLAIAAYNCGPGAVHRAIKRTGTKNFRRLQGSLPAETRNYVNKYISIHYFFEGVAGVTIFCNDELKKHTKDVAVFLKEKQQERELVRTNECTIQPTL